MLKRLKVIIKNKKLQKENEALYEENKQNRNDIEDLEIQKIHAKSLAEYTISEIFELEQIDRSGIAEESKIKRRNIILNDLRKKNINIIRELSNKKGSGR